MSTKGVLSAAVASLMISSAALAATETGSIKTIDMDKHQLILDTGKTFETSLDLKSYKVGDKVTVDYDTKDGNMVASKIEMAK